MVDSDFEVEDRPKKKFLGLFGSNKDDSSDILVGEKDMPTDFMPDQQPQGQDDILAKLLGGAFGGGGQQAEQQPVGPGRSQFYQDDWQYQGINQGYKPISDTYQAPKYEKTQYKSFEYKSPEFESDADGLFGPARGESFINSPALKETGVRSALMESSEKNAFSPTGMNENLFGGSLKDSPLFKSTGMSDMLFRDANTPILQPESAKPQPMQAPGGDAYLKPEFKTNLFGNPMIESEPKEVAMPEESVVTEADFIEEPISTPIEIPVQRQISMPTPTVSQQIGGQFKKGPGRPKLSTEEKARRKAMRESSMMNEPGMVQ